MCENHKFVQLHLHDSYSLLDGVSDQKRLIAKAIEYNHYAIATTNHGNPAGIYSFWKEAKKQGIKPILGLEFYITDDLTKKISYKTRTFDDKDFHQSVYIKNQAGYLNYNYLTYVSYTEGFYYKPRIDFNLLFKHKEGLIVTSSCMASKTSSFIREGMHKEAEEVFKDYLYEFGEDFYGEIQFNEVEGQKEINDFILHLCKKYNVPTIIGGDVHYLNPEDNELQDAVIRSKRSSEGSDWVISARKLYFHDTTDYFKFNKELGWNYDESIIIKCFENSVKFADKINFEFETGKYHLPKIDTGDLSSKEFIEKVTWEGLEKIILKEREFFSDKYTDEDLDKLQKQVKYELEVFDKLGINDYMLLVYDIIKWEKENGYYVGPGRGCFLPDSKVQKTDNSSDEIKNIKIGDKVKNYFSNEAEVEFVWEYNISEEIVELEFENGTIIKCTKKHEIYTKNRGWVKAENLANEDEIAEIKNMEKKILKKKF